MKVKTRFKNMDIVERPVGFSRPRLDRQILVSPLLLALLFATWPENLSSYQEYKPRLRTRRRSNTRSRRPRTCSSW